MTDEEHGGGSKLSPALVARVQATLHDHAGLEPPPWVLEARLSQRMAALGLSDGTAYAELIGTARGSGELGLLVEALRVGETRFFRHRAHINALDSVVVPGLMAGDRPVRAWSAGCASGEEAYTVAMVLMKRLGRRRPVTVLATDISEQAIEAARQREYPEQAIRNVPASMREFGFDRIADDRWRVSDRVASAVTFRKHNLAEDHYPTGFDLILCRNVLIYFSPTARERVIHRLIDSLAPERFLFVGYAESLRDFRALEAVRTPDAILYRKSSPAIARPTRPAPAAPDAPPRRAPTPPAHSTPSAARAAPLAPPPRVAAEDAVVELRGRYGAGDRLSTELSEVIAGPYRRVVVDLDGAEFLDDSAAATLRRARSAAGAAGIEFQLVAQRAGTQRWLRRHALADAAAPESPGSEEGDA